MEIDEGNSETMMPTPTPRPHLQFLQTNFQFLAQKKIPPRGTTPLRGLRLSTSWVLVHRGNILYHERGPRLDPHYSERSCKPMTKIAAWRGRNSKPVLWEASLRVILFQKQFFIMNFVLKTIFWWILSQKQFFWWILFQKRFFLMNFVPKTIFWSILFKKQIFDAFYSKKQFFDEFCSTNNFLMNFVPKTNFLMNFVSETNFLINFVPKTIFWWILFKKQIFDAFYSKKQFLMNFVPQTIFWWILCQKQFFWWILFHKHPSSQTGKTEEH